MLPKIPTPLQATVSAINTCGKYLKCCELVQRYFFVVVLKLAWVNTDFAHVLLFALSEIKYFQPPENSLKGLFNHLINLIVDSKPTNHHSHYSPLTGHNGFFFFKETFSDLKPSNLSVSLVLWLQWTQKEANTNKIGTYVWSRMRFDLKKKKGAYSASEGIFFSPPVAMKMKTARNTETRTSVLFIKFLSDTERHWTEVKSTWWGN